MKVLLSAVACHPTRGSESHFGWTAVRALSKRHELWVLAHANDQPGIEEAKRQGQVADNVHFLFHHGLAKWGKSRIASRIKAWADYARWSHSVLATACDLKKKVDFDVAHHVTLSTWRVPCRLWKIGVPFVWGPIGGAEVFPSQLLPTVSPSSGIFEIARRLQGRIARLSPAVRQTANQADIILASTPETRVLMGSLCKAPVRQVSSAFFFEEEFSRLEPMAKPEGPLQLFAGGEVEGRKGISIALDALAKLKRQGISFRYIVGGHGHEVGYLQRRVGELGLRDEVSLGERFSGPDYHALIRRSHVYLLPSLRDNAPVTLMEAMLAGCVPVVAACGGPGWIVTPECGFATPVGNSETMSATLAEYLRSLAENPRLLQCMGKAARQRIQSEFNEHEYLRQIGGAYEEARERHPYRRR